ncbi:MAG: hypothetical protein M3O70_12665 [Actinomycetota bacterium]|nr:hypothetical protein [Actinomycetota bacterium]
MTQPTAWRRARRQLSAETKWEIFLQVTAGEISQADAARRWQVDVSTIIGIRRTVKDAALAVLARKPGRPARERDWQLEAARHQIDQLTEAVKAQAIELALVRGKRAGPSRPAARPGAGRGQGDDPEVGRRCRRRRCAAHLGDGAAGRVG